MQTNNILKKLLSTGLVVAALAMPSAALTTSALPLSKDHVDDLYNKAQSDSIYNKDHSDNLYNKYQSGDIYNKAQSKDLYNNDIAEGGSADSGAFFAGKKDQGIRLYPGGLPIGISLLSDGVTVVGMADIRSEATLSGESKLSNPAYDAGIRIKDRIVRVNGRDVFSADEITKKIENCSGEGMSITVKRGEDEFNFIMYPVKDATDGKYKAGIRIKDSTAGIGTLTYVVPETGVFGGLGHGVCDSDNGEIIKFKKGKLFNVTIDGVIKGVAGVPGQLKGYFSQDSNGSVKENTQCGIFGVLSEIPQELGEPISIAKRSDVKSGKAEILCTLGDDGVQKYEVQISKINLSEEGNKCFMITVTDDKLIDRTGGIVQGMSGSPIIQNGKLIGAVTHVLVNEPTKGYGIFIENMLKEAENSKKLSDVKKAA